jgi:uncharacterized protein
VSKSFLDAARQGKNHWWRYLLVIGLVELYWGVLGGFVTLGIAIFFLTISGQITQFDLLTSPALLEQIADFWQTPSIAVFITTTLPFLLLWIGIAIGIKRIHQRKFRTLISADTSIHLKRILAGFGVWSLIIVIPEIIFFLLDSSNYLWTFEPGNWLLFLPIALLLTPIQTSAEEFYFRGYLLQGLGLITRQPLILILVTSVLFAIPHFGNPEMQRGAVWVGLTYLTWGIFFATITLKDNRLELALGVHAANNIFSFLVVNTSDSVLPSPAILTLKDTGDPKLTLVFFLAQIAIFYYVFFGRRKQPTVAGTS